MNVNLDSMLCLEMDVEAVEDVMNADYSYIDNVIGDDLDNEKYHNFSNEDDDYADELE